jgi:hypothetical protein
MNEMGFGMRSGEVRYIHTCSKMIIRHGLMCEKPVSMYSGL